MASIKPGEPTTSSDWKAVPKGQLAAWCLFDWGNSAFAAIILSFVFAPYFTESVAASREQGSQLWGQAMAISALTIAVLSPIVGAFCDKGGRQKRWLFSFSALAIIATAFMWFVTPDNGSVPLALGLVIIANTSFELGYVFYNAILPRIAPKRLIGRVSGWGWGFGYLGSLSSIAVVLVLFVDGHMLDGILHRASSEHIRIAAPFAAVWFAVFASILFLTVPDLPATGKSTARVVKEGIGEVLATIRHIKRLPSIGWYLAAHMVYIDGLNTLFIFGPIFAAGTIGLSASEVLRFGIGMYVAAGIGSFAFGWLDDRLGGKRLLLISLSALCALSIAVLLSRTAGYFTAFAWGTGLFIGPVQSASRSLMARLSPPQLRNQLFGLYSLAGKATAPLGPLAVGTVMAATGSQRLGLALTVVWMAIGALLLLPVREPLGSEEKAPPPDSGT